MSMPEFCSVIHRIARKRHTCTECGGHIEPLDCYERVTGCWDGSVQTFKTCLFCEQARDFYVDQSKASGMRDPENGDYCFGLVFQDLIDITSVIPIGTGKRFQAYRHFVAYKQRRQAASEKL